MDSSAAEPDAQYTYILLSDVCTKVRITDKKGSTFNYEDQEGHTSFIWENEWADKRCGDSKLKPWPGDKKKHHTP